VVLLAMWVVVRADKNLGFFKEKIWFLVFRFLITNSRRKITAYKQRFGHVNATNRNSYLNIICIKLVTQMKKN